MTFQVGQRVKTRGGGWATVTRFVGDDGKFTAQHDDGVSWMHVSDGAFWGSKGDDPRDLLPGAIEDEGGGEQYQCSVCQSDWGSDLRAAVRCCTNTKTPTPDTDTKWDRDARAAPPPCWADTTMWGAEDYARWAGDYADALAAERARRGEVG